MTEHPFSFLFSLSLQSWITIATQLGALTSGGLQSLLQLAFRRLYFSAIVQIYLKSMARMFKVSQSLYLVNLQLGPQYYYLILLNFNSHLCSRYIESRMAFASSRSDSIYYSFVKRYYHLPHVGIL